MKDNQETTNPRTAAQNRQLYWLLGRLNIHDADVIAEMVWEATNHRTFHTSEMSYIECMLLINRLTTELRGAKRLTRSEQIERSTNEALRNELDRKRKGVIRAIFRWGELQGLEYTMEYVKAIACRAAGAESFNKISPEALTRLYHEFCRKQQVVQAKTDFYNPISLN